MSNLPPCGACSYTPATETLSITISPHFVGVLTQGRLTLRADTGEEIVHKVPFRMGAGGTAIVKGLPGPRGAKITGATLAWVVAGDPSGQTSAEQAIAIYQ